jgi:hypothetical protein
MPISPAVQLLEKPLVQLLEKPLVQLLENKPGVGME